MVKVNFKDGQTRSFDLSIEQDTVALRSALEGDGCLDSITALAIFHRKVLHTFPKPVGMTVRSMGAELILDRREGRVAGEVVWFSVGDLTIRYVVYNKTAKVTKIEVVKGHHFTE